jgi:EAL domain-containing protein (putative c-di-GMP-specific phosphodiesterase class I)
LAQSNDTTLAELHRLIDVGVSLVMDDFGTGYSSLNYLWKFPFAKLKIDRAFVAASTTGGSAVTAIVRAITDLARTLGMRITVEGVETSEQIELFAGLGCEQMQGFYLGRPMPAVNVAAAILGDFCASEKFSRAPAEAAAACA